MIIGVGTDIVQIKRIEKILSTYGEHFINKCFTPKELQRYENKNLSTKQFATKLAKLFAAKEATAKAIGTGFRYGVRFKDIQILSNDIGKPYIKITGTTKNYIEKNIKSYKNLNYNLSLSDDYPVGIAFVVIEKMELGEK